MELPFYNANESRAYPFEAGTVDSKDPADNGTLGALPDGVIVDCGFIIGPQPKFDPTTHRVWLEQIDRTGSTFKITFATDAPDLIGVPLTFTRETSDEDYLVEEAESTSDLPFESESASASASESGSESGSTDTCEEEPLWSGYLVTGEISALTDLLPNDGTVGRNSGQALVEPPLVQVIGTVVESINLGNDDRTRVDSPAGCDPIDWPHSVGITHVESRCLQGPVRFKPGYNAIVRQDSRSNELIVSGSVGAGEGEPCEEVKHFPDETAPPGSHLLSGGPRCNDVVRSLNGVGGRSMNLVSGQGVDVTADPANHRVIVDANMNALAICFNSDQLDVSESV